MMPTLNEMGDVVLVDKLSCGHLGWDPLTRNDVVVAKSANKAGGTVCKRVIGLPGDEITPPNWESPVVIPEGHIWIEGDNPQNSVDSRFYGPIPASYVYGRVIARVWPPTQAQWIHRDNGRPTSNTLYERDMRGDPELRRHAHETIEQRRREAQEEEERRLHWERFLEEVARQRQAAEERRLAELASARARLEAHASSPDASHDAPLQSAAVSDSHEAAVATQPVSHLTDFSREIGVSDRTATGSGAFALEQSMRSAEVCNPTLQAADSQHERTREH